MAIKQNLRIDNYMEWRTAVKQILVITGQNKCTMAIKIKEEKKKKRGAGIKWIAIAIHKYYSQSVGNVTRFDRKI